LTSNRKTSVVIFLPNLLVGGAEETTLRLIDYLLKLDYKINLVVATNKISDFYKIPTDINYINLYSKRLATSFWKALRTIKTLDPDLVFSTLWYSNLLTVIICKILNKHSVIREAGLDYRSQASFSNKFFKLIASFFYRKADKVIAISDSLNQNIQNELKVRKSNISTIYNPVENYFDRKYLENNDLRKYFSKTSVNTVIALSAIRFDHIKFSYNLFLAIKNIKEIDIRLLLVGDGNKRDEIQQFLSQNQIEEKVVLLDWTDNIYSFINSCDLYISSSKFEGLGNAYLAAQLLKIKCLSSNIPASNEINEIFKNGESFNDEVEDIMSKIVKTVNQPELIDDIPLETINMFSEDVCFGKYHEIFSMVNK